MTAAVMFALARGKARTGAALGNIVLTTEGRVTLIDGLLAAAVQLGLLLNSLAGLWWADPAAGYVLVHYRCERARRSSTTPSPGPEGCRSAPCAAIAPASPTPR